MSYTLDLQDLRLSDLPLVGGKNASLGEMLGHLSGSGVRVPGGFAITVEAYSATLAQNDLHNKIAERLKGLDTNDINALVQASQEIRTWILQADLPADVVAEIRKAFKHHGVNKSGTSWAVRSSATAEDLPDASFAGQQDTLLNVRGEDAILTAIRQVYASLYTDRAISYRQHHGFEHTQVLLSACVQKMVACGDGCSGVMFTLDTESNFRDVVLINASYGLGEAVVGGSVNPDEYYVFKPSLAQGKSAVIRKHLGAKASRMVYGEKDGLVTEEVPLEQRQRYCLSDEQAQDLARLGVIVENHYDRPMDIEWGLDANDGELYILQARPETVASRRNVQHRIENYQLKERGEVLVKGRSIGKMIASGKVCIVKNISEMDKVGKGEVLVTDMTDPDWEPVMSRAAAIITNRGGRTCHAAIIARELGVPAIVGTVEGTDLLSDGQQVTINCAEGDEGLVHKGALDYDVIGMDIANLPEPEVQIMMNVGNPDRAFDFQWLPNHGVGLARLEFIINRTIGVHPNAILQPEVLDSAERRQLDRRMAGYASPREFYVGALTQGIATLAACFQGKPVVVRLSDFKSNEYSRLIGGRHFEPDEENPMIGLRGASRYVSKLFRPCFEMECEALLRARNDYGLENIEIMVPFVRSLDEAKRVVDLLEDNGLSRGENGLKIIMMCELPVNALMAEEFLEYFDGFSIGSNDLTQLTLGLDRDSGLVAHLFDERNPAIYKMLESVISTCRKQNKYVGICGQGPSDHPDFMLWLVDQGISSISLNPDTVLDTWMQLVER